MFVVLAPLLFESYNTRTNYILQSIRQSVEFQIRTYPCCTWCVEAIEAACKFRLWRCSVFALARSRFCKISKIKRPVKEHHTNKKKLHSKRGCQTSRALGARCPSASRETNLINRAQHLVGGERE